MFGRICIVCDKKMGNSGHRVGYKLSEPEGCFLECHSKCEREYENNPEKYYLKDKKKEANKK